jgi:GTP pyrophosphokinase
MEDLSLKFLNRETFQQIKDIVAEKLEQRNKFLEFAHNTIKAEAKAAGINVIVESRAKHFYSVYMKMRKRNKTASEIFDLAGIRIICDNIENCYTLLGLAHRLGKPGNGTFRDYIARPKPNGYQSLHTTVVLAKGADAEQESDETGKLLEIQIRTREMHQIAEHGIASHWIYKKGSMGEVPLRHQDDKSTGEFSSSWLEEIKREILRKYIYVFTPQGKVIRLPVGGTPIDFAYQVHSAVGEHCVGAKANGHIIPLRVQLENAQVVEILTSPSAHPHFGWLESVKSSKARSKIRSWLSKNDEFYGAEKQTEAKKKPVPEGNRGPLVRGLRARRQVQELPVVSPPSDRKDQFQKSIQPQISVLQVRIGDEKNMMIRFARCCNPVPGDLITGYVSRGRGIIIHRQNCPNLVNIPEVEKRKIAAEWEITEQEPVKRPKLT